MVSPVRQPEFELVFAKRSYHLRALQPKGTVGESVVASARTVVVVVELDQRSHGAVHVYDLLRRSCMRA